MPERISIAVLKYTVVCISIVFHRKTMLTKKYMSIFTSYWWIAEGLVAMFHHTPVQSFAAKDQLTGID